MTMMQFCVPRKFVVRFFQIKKPIRWLNYMMHLVHEFLLIHKIRFSPVPKKNRNSGYLFTCFFVVTEEPEIPFLFKKTPI